MADLKLERVGKTYGGKVEVLKDINLDIKTGELIVFVGASYFRFLGQDQLSQPRPRAGAQKADVVGDLVARARHRGQGTRQEHHRVMGGERLELVGRGDEGQAGDARHVGGLGLGMGVRRLGQSHGSAQLDGGNQDAEQAH